MSLFDKLLTEALEAASPVTGEEFMNFVAAIVTSTSREKIPEAIKRAQSLSSEQLTTVIRQVQFTGSPESVQLAIHSNPEYVTLLSELARKVLPEEGIRDALGIVGVPRSPVVEKSAGDKCDQCTDGVYTPIEYDGDYDGSECSSCGGYLHYCNGCDRTVAAVSWDTDHETCYDCVPNEEEYNSEADYFSQSEDAGGH
jgi:hypothetical protein